MSFSIQQILFAALGSAIGGLLRFATGECINLLAASSKHFWPTLLVNLVGSLLIGISFALSIKHQWNEVMVAFIIIGMLGGFTTFSSFSLDLLRLFQDSEALTAIGYLLGSVFGGLILAFIGYYLITNEVVCVL